MLYVPKSAGAENVLITSILMTQNLSAVNEVGTGVHYDMDPVTMSGDPLHPASTQRLLQPTAVPTTLAQCLALCADLSLVTNLHVKSNVASDEYRAGVHKAIDSTALATFNAVPIPTSQTTMVTFLTAFQVVFAAHAASTTSHPTADAGAWVAALAAGTVGTTLAQSITFIALCRTAINSHVAAVGVGAMMRLVG